MRSSLSWLSCGLAAIIAVSCMDTSAQQCRAAEDCAQILNLPASRTTCNEGFCEAIPNVVANEPPAPCTSNVECTNRHGGVPHLCRSDECLLIKDGDVISDVTPNYADGNPILIGFVAPMTNQEGFRAPDVKDWIETVKFAAQDWQVNSGGGLVIDGSADRRPIAALFCDSKDDPTRVKTCVDAMAKLKVPVIVTRSYADTNAAITHTLASNILLFCSDCDASDLTQLPTRGLRWVGAPPVAGLTDLRVEWGKRVEDQVRQERNLPRPAPIRVAFVSSAEKKDSATLRSALKFDGVIKWHNVMPGATDWRSVADDIATFRPHIIVTAEIGFTFHSYLLPEVEARWGSGIRPRYILSESESYDPALERSIGVNEDLRKRITGVWASASEAVYVNWETFEDRFARSSPIGGYALGGNVTGFEAFYTIAFALTAAVTSPQTTTTLTGEDVSRGIFRLMGGPPSNVVNFQDGEIDRGMRILKRGESLDARGVYSDLEWDTATGILKSDAAIWCPSIAPQGTEANELWHYDGVAKAPIGEPDPSLCIYE